MSESTIPMSESTIPRQALWLGIAGLVPTAAALVAILAWPAGRGLAASIALAYGAVIASFVGGAWWGLAAGRAAPEALPRYLQTAIMPALVAWLAALSPPTTGLAVLALMFAVLPPTDRRLMADDVAPAWWFALRRPLSFAMAGLHAAGALVLLVSLAD